MNCYLDIETIPSQTNRASFIDAAVASYKPPSTLTKEQACFALCYSKEQAKVLSKAQAVALWADEFGATEAEGSGDEQWRKTSFDGGTGHIISIAWAVEDGAIQSVNWSLDKAWMTEKEALSIFFDSLKLSLKRHEPYFIGHAIPFDLNFLFRRAVVLGIKPPFKLPFGGYHGRDYFDNEQAWCRRGKNISQDKLCKALGLEGKPDGIDGSKVWDEVKAGNIDKVVEYNIDDVRAVREVYNRLNFI